MFVYNMIFRYRLADIFEKVKTFEDSLNGYMADFGFSEKMVSIGEAPLMKIESSCELTQAQLDILVDEANVCFQKNNSKMECIRIELV